MPTLEGGKVLCLGEDGKVEKILKPKDKIFTIGYYMSCDFIYEHPEVKGIHCAIVSDSFGRITVKNYCEKHPIFVNGEAIAGKRPLLTGSTIEVLGKQFRWEYESPKAEDDGIQTTPIVKTDKTQQAPTSEPSAHVYKCQQKRFTIHSFAYGLNSNRDEDIENPSECTIIQPLQMETNTEIMENQSTANLVDNSVINKENCTPKRRLSICSQSEIVVTSFSPRTPGMKTAKGFAFVTPAKKSPKSLYATPKSVLSEHNLNQSGESRDFSTPQANTPKLTSTSMYLIDLTTPLKPKTPIKQTPLLKSALKNSVKGSARNTAKKATFSGISGLNIQGRKIALETPAKRKSVSMTPKKFQPANQPAESENNSSLADSVVDQYTISSSVINTDSMSVAEDSSVIEISSDGTPNRPKGKSLQKTPQLLARKAIITSAKKARTAEKDFAKKVKNNIERISENLSNIGGIRNRRSSLPNVSAVVGRQNLLSQSSAGISLKSATTPQRIHTTSTPMRSRKSISTVIQSTPLKTPQRVNLTDSFRRHSCISSNQMTPNAVEKTPKSIVIARGIKTPKNVNRSVQFADKSANKIQLNEEDALNATFTVDEEEELNTENNAQEALNAVVSESLISEANAIKQTGDISRPDVLVEEGRSTKSTIDEEIQVSDISAKPDTRENPLASENENSSVKSSDVEGLQRGDICSTPATGHEKVPPISRRSASFTIETPKQVKTPKNAITRSIQKQFVDHKPIEILTDSKGLKELLKTPKGLNRTPVFVGVKELLKTPKVEASGKKGDMGIKSLMKTPVKTPKTLQIKQLFNTPAREEREMPKTPIFLKSPEQNNMSVEELPQTPRTAEIKKQEEDLTNSPNDRKINNKILETSGISEKQYVSNKSIVEIATAHLSECEENKEDQYDLLNATKTIGNTPEKDVQKEELDHNSRKSYCKVETPEEIQTPDTPDVLEDEIVSIKSPLDAEVQSGGIAENTAIKSTPIANHGRFERDLRKSPYIKTPKNVQTLEKTNALDEIQNNEVQENTDVSNRPILEYERTPRKLGEETPKTIQTLETTYASEDESEHAKSFVEAEVQNDEVLANVDVQSTSILGDQRTPRKPRRSTITKMKTPNNVQILETSESENRHSKSSVETDVQNSEESTDIPNTSMLEYERSPRKLRRSTIFKTETVKKMQTLEKADEIQNNKVQESTVVPNTSILEYERTPRKLHIDSPKNVKILETTLEDKNELAESSVEAEVPHSGVLAGIDIENTPILEYERTPRKFRRSTISKIKTPKKVQTLEPTDALEDENGFTNSSVNAIVKNSEVLQSTDNPNTPILKYERTPRKLRRSTISKIETLTNIQTPENVITRSMRKKIAEGVSTEKKTNLKRVSNLEIKTPKNLKQNLRMVAKKTSPIEVYREGKAEAKQNIIEQLMKTPTSSSTHLSNVESFLQSDLIGDPRNLNDVEEGITGANEMSQTADNINKSFNSPSKDIQSSNAAEHKGEKMEPRKLCKSATFIIDSPNAPCTTEDLNACSAQKILVDCDSVGISTEALKHSEALLNTPKNLEKTPGASVEKETGLAKTPNLLEVKELCNSPKPSIEINFVPELMKTPKLLRDTEDNYHRINELLETPKSLEFPKCGQTPNKSLKDDETGEIGDYETLLIEDDSYPTTPTILQVEANPTSHVNDEHYPTTPTILEFRSNSIKPRKSVGFLIEKEQDVCSPSNLKMSAIQEGCEQTDAANNATELLTTPIYMGMRELLKTPKPETDENLVGVRELIKTPAKTPKPVRIKGLFNSPKPQQEENLVGVKELLIEPTNLDQTTILIGVKELLNTPKNETTDDIRELGLKGLLKTPGKTPKPVRIRELFHTPKPEKEENYVGVKELMIEPKNLDQTTVLVGMKELLKTPKEETEYELRELGLKGLMKTPAKTPKPVRIRDLFGSVKPEKEENFVGVKELLNSPKNLDQTTILIGVKELLKTPKNDTSAKTPECLGIKEMFNSPKITKEPRLGGLKELIKTPQNLKDSNINLTGVKELLKTPKNIADTDDFLGLPDMFSTPHRREFINKVVIENLMKTPVVESHYQEIDQNSQSPNNAVLGKQVDDLAFKTPSAKMVMVLGTPQSVNINAERSATLTGGPPIYDLKENMTDIEDVFPTDVIEAEEHEALSAEDSFDRLIGRMVSRKSYGRRRTPNKDSSLTIQLDEEERTELPKTDVVEWVEKVNLSVSLEEIDENSRDKNDSEAVFSMSGIKSLEKDVEDSEQMDVQINSQDEDLKNNADPEQNITSIPIEISSFKTMEKETNLEVEVTPRKTGKEGRNSEDKIEDKTVIEKGKEEEDKQDVAFVQNESTSNKHESFQKVVEKVEEAAIKSDTIFVESEITTATNTRSRRERVTKIQLPQKQKLENVVPTQTRTRRGRKNNDIVGEKLKENGSIAQPVKAASSEEIKEGAIADAISTVAPSEKGEGVDMQVQKDVIEEHKQLTAIKEQASKVSESIPRVKATRRGARKRKGSLNDTEKEDHDHQDLVNDHSIVPKTTRTTRNKRHLKTQNQEEQNTEHIHDDTVEVVKTRGRAGKRVKIVEAEASKQDEDVIEEKDSRVQDNPIELSESDKAQENIKEPKISESKKSEFLPQVDQKQPALDDGNKEESISDQPSSEVQNGNEPKESSVLPVLTRRRGGRTAVKDSTKIKLSPVQKRKSDSETEEEVVPRKRVVSKRAFKKDDESKELNSDTKASSIRFVEGRTGRKVDQRLDGKQEVLTIEVEREVMRSRGDTSKSEIEDTSADAGDLNTKTKAETTPPQKGRNKRKAVHNFNDTKQGSSNTEPEIEAPPLRRGRPRRKAENAMGESNEQNPETKAETTPSKRGRPKRIVEDVVPQQEVSGEPETVVIPQRGRPRRKADNVLNLPKADTLLREKNLKVKVDNLLNMSTDELTPIKPANLKNLAEGKENVSTPKTQPQNLLEFKTPMSAAPRARRVLRSNSIQLSTPVLQEQTSQEIVIIDDSEDNIESSLPAIASIRTRGRRRINSTKESVEVSDVDIEMPEKSINAPSAVASGRGRGRPRMNSTTEELQIFSGTSENAIPAATSSQTRRRLRINSAKDELHILDSDVDVQEISGRTRARKKVVSTKKDIESVDNEVKQSDSSKNTPPTATLGKTRGRKKINSKTEVVENFNAEVEQPERPEHAPPVTKSTTTRGRKKKNVTTEEVASLPVEVEIAENAPSVAASGRARARRNASSAKEEVQNLDSNEEQTKENVVSTRTRTTRRKKVS